MELVKPIAVAVAIFIGLPLLLFLVTLGGLVAWIVAASVLPLVVLAVILWLGWFRRREDDGPYRDI